MSLKELFKEQYIPSSSHPAGLSFISFKPMSLSVCVQRHIIAMNWHYRCCINNTVSSSKNIPTQRAERANSALCFFHPFLIPSKQTRHCVLCHIAVMCRPYHCHTVSSSKNHSCRQGRSVQTLPFCFFSIRASTGAYRGN